jgi:Anti-sigma-K factor rskA, C-terminal
VKSHRDRQRRQAAERVLDELDGAETGTAQPVAKDPELAAETTSMRAIAKLISEVPAEAWQPIPAPEHEPGPTPANRRHRRSLTRSRALAAAVVLACLVIGFAVGALINRGPAGPAPARPPHAATATLRPLPGQPAATIARAQLTSAGQIMISFSRLPRPGAGRFYEAWLMTSTTKLIPVASFRPDARGRALVETSLPAPVGAFRYIDVSLQQTGAGPAHSGDSVLRGPTAPLARPPG